MYFSHQIRPYIGCDLLKTALTTQSTRNKFEYYLQRALDVIKMWGGLPLQYFKSKIVV
jgi:hypothetical protein